MSRHRRIFVLLMAVGIIGGLLAPSLAQTTAPRQGGTLTVAWNISAVGSLDPKEARATLNWLVGKHLLDPLARLDPKTGEPKPALAKSWTVSADGRSITYVLRDDVVFHDGTRFDAAAAKFNLDRFAEKDAFSYSLMGGEDYVGTEVVDRFTIRITWKRPQGFWWDIQAYRIGFHSPVAVRAAGADYGSKVMVGTGPFKLVRYVERTEIVMERFPQYRWGSPIYKHSGPAYLDNLIFKTVQEPTTRLSALERDEVQFIEGQQLQHVYGEWSKRRGFAGALNLKAGTTRALHINVKRPPLDDQRLRQAIAHAMNREVLVRLPRYSGLARVAYGTIAGKNWEPGSLDQFKPFNFPYNPKRARELLEQAGWRLGSDGIRVKDGKRLQIEAVEPQVFLNEVQPIQAMLADVGIDMKIRIVDLATWFSVMERRQVDIVLRSRSGPGLLFGIEDWACQFPDSPSGLCNPELDRIVDQLNVTMDLKRKRDLVSRAQRIILVSASGIPLVDEYYPWLMRNTVQDVFYPYDSWPRFYDAWLSR
ncbi:MAG TPA: ABC transporter substrate-binding protein [bacterium]|nr:ABC transporter substrate-binding protein [bacterium]